MADVLYAVTDHIATLTLNRPDNRNALSVAMLDALLAALAQAKADPAAHVVLLTSSSPAAF